MPLGTHHIPQRVPELIEDGEIELPGQFQLLIQRLVEHFKELNRQVIELEVQIKAWHRANPASCKLEKIPGIGPITASALVASIWDARRFANGRQVAAWLGLVPDPSCPTLGVKRTSAVGYIGWYSDVMPMWRR